MFNRWIQSFTSENTRENYTSVVKGFLHMILGPGDLDELAKRYVDTRGTEKQIMEDVDRYVLAQNAKAPLTRASRISIVKTFLRDVAHVDLPGYFWVKFRRRQRGGVRPVLRDRAPTTEELRQILSHMDLKGRLLFALMAAAGTRIAETLTIELSDLDLDVDPPRVYLRGETTKNGEDRVVFFTQEVKGLMLEWFKVRRAWIVEANSKGYQPREERDPDNERKLLPFSPESAREIWRLALKKAELYETDHRLHSWVTIRTHSLRKRFRTQLPSVIPLDAVETIMGHAGYATIAYRRYTEEELASFYKQAEHLLILSEHAGRIEERTRDLETEVRVLKGENESLRDELRQVKVDTVDKTRRAIREMLDAELERRERQAP